METNKSSTDTETTQIIGKNFTSVFLEDLVRNSKLQENDTVMMLKICYYTLLLFT